MQHICHCSSSWVSKIGTSTYHAFIFMFVPQMEVSINGGTPEWMVYNRTSYIYIKMDNLGVPPLLGNSIFEKTPSMFFGARQFHVVPVLLWSEMGLSPKQQSTPKSIGLSSFPHWKCHIYISWLVVSTPLKNMKVSWDDEIPNIWNNKNVPNHQPVSYLP